MVIDFKNIDLSQHPTLVIKNLDGTPIGVLGHAFNLKMSARYNEVSEISFTYPQKVDGEKVSSYDLLTGMRVVDVVGIGQFLLFNPTVKDDGVRTVKECKAYSLEYELTFKQISIHNSTYSLWNPVSPSDSVLGMILETGTSWSIGSVDDDLVGKYRTFEVSDTNVYEFIKSTVQTSYNCIFDFDTYNRLIHVRSAESSVKTNPVFLSLNNLIKDISIEEDTENIITCLDVNGAEDVNIRTVNPMGTNKIYNLDYFMNDEHLPVEIIEKWSAWKSEYQMNQLPYFNLSIERSLQISRFVSEQAALAEMNGTLDGMEYLRSVYIEAISQGIDKDDDLHNINSQISNQKQMISNQKQLLDDITDGIDNFTNQLKSINQQVSFSSFLSTTELESIGRYFKEQPFQDSTFVAPTVQSYNIADKSESITDSAVDLMGAKITQIYNPSALDKEVYYSTGGTITLSSVLSANSIRTSIERDSSGKFVMSAYMSDISHKGKQYPSGNISVTGYCSEISSDVIPDTNFPDSYGNGTYITYEIDHCNLFFTRNTTEYEQRAIEWDLYDYAQDILEKLSSPSYTFSVNVANFLALKDFEAFKNQLILGDRVYLDLNDGGDVVQPVALGLDIDFESISGMSIIFSDSYKPTNSEMALVDILSKSISMGKTVDFSKHRYSAFTDSGASTSVKEFMTSALDYAKNKVLSSSGQAISLEESGLHLRSWNEEMTGYTNEEIRMINNGMYFTDDGWNSVKMAVGKYHDTNLGMGYGVIAPSLFGTLIAGSNLLIESEKKDGGKSVFRVDATGASLHNATFDIYNGTNTQITLNPHSGIAIGSYPLYTDDDYTIDESKAKFWVDTDGNLHLKGILDAASGRFAGIVQASDFLDGNGNSMMTNYKFKSDYLELKGLSIKNGDTTTFQIDNSGNVSMRGNIQMTGGSITWANVNETDSSAYKRANSAYSEAISAYDEANRASDLAKDIANGVYSNGTFIRGTEIFSPTIRANEFTVIPESIGDSVGSYSMKAYFGNELYHMLKISYFASTSPTVNFSSPDGANAYWYFPETNFSGKIDFSYATVTGLSAQFA